jgi:hypothetical protein
MTTQKTPNTYIGGRVRGHTPRDVGAVLSMSPPVHDHAASKLATVHRDPPPTPRQWHRRQRGDATARRNAGRRQSIWDSVAPSYWRGGLCVLRLCYFWRLHLQRIRVSLIFDCVGKGPTERELLDMGQAVREIRRQIMRRQINEQRTEDVLSSVMGWAEDMRGRTWGTPSVIDLATLDDIEDAVSVLRARYERGAQ